MADRRIYLLAQFDEATNQALAALYDALAQAGLVGEQTKGIPYHFTMESIGVYKFFPKRLIAEYPLAP